MDEVRKNFPPEFLNRIDEIITFNKLSRDLMEPILEIELKSFFNFEIY